MMQTQELTTQAIDERSMCATFRASTKINLNFPDVIESSSKPDSNLNLTPVDLFKHVGSTTLAERFPLLTCFAISFGLLVSALITEVECLKGSGYFWR